MTINIGSNLQMKRVFAVGSERKMSIRFRTGFYTRFYGSFKIDAIGVLGGYRRVEIFD